MSYERFEQFDLSPLESHEFQPLDNAGIFFGSANDQSHFSLLDILKHSEKCGKRFLIQFVTPQNIFGGRSEKIVTVSKKEIKFESHDALLVHIRDVSAELKNEELETTIQKLNQKQN